MLHIYNNGEAIFSLEYGEKVAAYSDSTFYFYQQVGNFKHPNQWLLIDTNVPGSVWTSQSATGPNTYRIQATEALVHYDKGINPVVGSNLWGTIGGDLSDQKDIDDRFSNLEDKYVYFEIYESIGSGTSGTVTVPTGASILLDHYVGGADCVLVAMDGSGKPTDTVPRTIGGAVVTSTLDAVGNHSFTGTPAAYPVAIVYFVGTTFSLSGNIDASKIVQCWDALVTTSPITGDGGISSPISIPPATALADGYMTKEAMATLNSAAIVGGSSSQVQYNDGGVLAGDAKLTWDKVSGVLRVGEGIGVFANNPFSVQTNVDTYAQVTFTNSSSHVDASGDIVIIADNGSDYAHFFDMGINSSTFSSVSFPIHGPNDCYLFAWEDNLSIGTGAAGKIVQIHAEGFLEDNISAEFDKDGVDVPDGNTYRLNGVNILQSDYDRSSEGLVSGGVITSNSQYTINISSGSGWIWDGSKFNKITWSSFSNLTPPNDQYNFIAIDDNGDVGWSITEHGAGYIRLGHVYKDVGTANVDVIWSTPEWVGDYQFKNNSFIEDIFGTIISTGFQVTEQVTLLKLSIAGGSLYSKLTELSYSVNTSFIKLYNSTSGIATDLLRNDNTVDTTLWNDVTKAPASAIVTMTTDYWAKASVIMSVGGVVQYVYPQGEYVTEDEAKSAPIPDADIYVGDGNALLATIVFQEGDTSIANRIYDIRPLMRRAFGTEVTTAGGTVVDHGSLTGLSDDDHTQYHNDARANTWLASKDTDDLSEGGNLYFTVERAQDATGAMADTNTLAYTDGTPLLAVKTQMSVASDANGLKLSGDSASPGNNKVYGTDASGAKGWKSDPAGGTLTDNLGIVVDGAGSVIATGSKGYREIPFACTINSWTILGKEAGSCVVDVKRCTYAGFPSTSSIAGTEKPTLSTAQKNQDTSLSTWTTSLASGDILEFVVDSASTVTRITLYLNVTRI